MKNLISVAAVFVSVTCFGSPHPGVDDKASSQPIAVSESMECVAQDFLSDKGELFHITPTRCSVGALNAIQFPGAYLTKCFDIAAKDKTVHFELILDGTPVNVVGGTEPQIAKLLSFYEQSYRATMILSGSESAFSSFEGSWEPVDHPNAETKYSPIKHPANALNIAFDDLTFNVWNVRVTCGRFLVPFVRP